ncbi:TonB-dependent receptor plug domain-containing protein [Caulobacter sp.]|uniref:TonB-dependent receptor plug domain-containing protein n=1 Tax=Caulobacter sp. TaxID=78 RepID=UPI003BAF730D
MRFKSFLLTATSLAAIAGAAQAQDAPSADDANAVEQVVVTGTRTTGRSRLDTLAPVDVVTAKSLQQRGATDISTALAATVPSINFPRPSNTDGTDAIRPVVLRGMGPDQTLVLVNGARRHTSALINVNGSVGRGSAAVDLNAIPSSAIDRIEVLRDGASAQYGSDAIAGVVNLRLREADHGGGVTVTYGQYVTSFDGYYGGKNDISDGAAATVAAWQGFKLGSDGFLTVSAQYRDLDPTNRADNDPRVTPSRITGRTGDPKTEDVSIYLNAAKPLAAGWEAYGWYGYQQRDANSAASFRLPGDASQNIPSVYPNGYLPLLTTDTEDVTAAAGLRGELGGFKIDTNLVYGRNDIDFGVENTLNPSYGPTSPHSFKAGGLTYDQLVFGLDASREVEVGLAGPLNVAFGLEARREGFQINAGEEASYARGTVSPTLAFGSRGFTGFAPSNAVDEDRHAVGVYVDLEGKVTEGLTVGVAGRYEDYSDFGTSTTGKFTARYDFSPSFALRGGVSTGFRAPSLQQQYYTATSITYVAQPDGSGGTVLVPFESGTYPSISPVGLALGGKPLKAEKSTNYSLGAVYRKGAFELTIDGYQIDVEDRIVLSELFSNAAGASNPNAAQIGALLAPYGTTAARFFINGVDTSTKGVDIVARYRINDEQAGVFDLTLAANVNDFSVDKTPVTTTLATPQSLFARQATLRFEKGTPREKVTLQGDWSKDQWGATLRSTFYGDVLAPGTANDGSTDWKTGVSGLIDAEARYTFPIGLTVSAGADNLFDQYTNQIPPNLNTSGAGPFSNFSPYGFNGRFLYTRLSYSW